MKEALTYIVGSLVEKSDEVNLDSFEDGNVIRFKSAKSFIKRKS